jgi:hypothetical protein
MVEIDMEVEEVATAVEIVVVVIAMVIVIVEVVTAAEMAVAMGKKGSQTIVKGMVAAAVVVVTDTMVAVTVIQVLETALALMTAPVNAPVVAADPLMMNVIENILPQELHLMFNSMDRESSMNLVISVATAGCQACWSITVIGWSGG